MKRLKLFLLSILLSCYATAQLKSFGFQYRYIHGIEDKRLIFHGIGAQVGLLRKGKLMVDFSYYAGFRKTAFESTSFFSPLTNKTEILNVTVTGRTDRFEFNGRMPVVIIQAGRFTHLLTGGIGLFGNRHLTLVDFASSEVIDYSTNVSPNEPFQVHQRERLDKKWELGALISLRALLSLWEDRTSDSEYNLYLFTQYDFGWSGYRHVSDFQFTDEPSLASTMLTDERSSKRFYLLRQPMNNSFSGCIAAGFLFQLK